MSAMRADVPVLRTPEELTAAWLSDALGGPRVEAFTIEPIGTGQMSESRRIAIDYARGGGGRSPRTVVLKTASADENSRGAGVGLGVYEREVRFYRELAPRIGGPLAHCHVAVIDPAEGWFTLLLEDVAPATQGDQIAGCDIAQATVAIDELARLHAPVFGDPQLGATPWLNQEGILTQALVSQLLDGFLERYGDQIAPEHQDVCRRLVASLDGWAADRRPPLGIVHGDYRLDNMLFGGADTARRFVAVDWQTVSWGPVMTDVSYFLGASLPVEERRLHEQNLVRRYFDALNDHGVRGFSWEECWSGYRCQSFLGILMTVAPAMLVERTDRGDAMFMACMARYAQQVLDLDALELLPAPGSGRPPALRPKAEDEGRHSAGAEELWNESWYFDAISDDGTLGMYTRLGLYPNLGVAWVTAFVCGPGRPTVAVIDFAAQLPDGDALEITTAAFTAEHLCRAALESFAVRLRGTGAEHEDAAAVLRAEPGRPVAVGFDLEWTTQGAPYAYRVATRYEIPCRVAGTIEIGEERIAFSGKGQRDHSWGTRDWWAAEWMWSAGHLDDGTRFHGVEFRLPDAPAIGVGYLQPPEDGVVELDRVSAEELVGTDGLITEARIEYGELALEIEPTAFGPLLLLATDGRRSEFPRAMCRVRAADGRAGAAWVEWNRNASLGG